MAHKGAQRIRNIAIVGHRGSGKTSLNEAILFEAGIVNRLGNVADGSTVSDSEADEQEREMSIAASLSSFEYDDRKINLIDTIEDDSLPDPQSALSATEMREAVADAIARLPEREKLVIALYYYENLTLREIGEVLGVTESRVSQLHTKAVLRLKSRLQTEVEVPAD